LYLPFLGQRLPLVKVCLFPEGNEVCCQKKRLSLQILDSSQSYLRNDIKNHS
jgi:hypothetical protein